VRTSSPDRVGVGTGVATSGLGTVTCVALAGSAVNGLVRRADPLACGGTHGGVELGV
jgi:hypothetical protein